MQLDIKIFVPPLCLFLEILFFYSAVSLKETKEKEVSLVGKAIILHIMDREFESPTSYCIFFLFGNILVMFIVVRNTWLCTPPKAENKY